MGLGLGPGLGLGLGLGLGSGRGGMCHPRAVLKHRAERRGGQCRKVIGREVRVV